ncbi:hypothetical protein [Microbacterium gorillae]|uniref:hypothetical protein n=1 Tax=Microbacterium gorillae TaxID=1231063 RepID=UPI003D961B31
MQVTQLNADRGWLDAPAAASVHRVDRALGRPLDINEAGRTWAQQMVFWQTYQRDGYPIALHPDTPSIHQLGNAIDTDDSDRAALLNEHGWVQTVYRGGVLVEPWHFEYDVSRDQHVNDPEPTAAIRRPEEDDMKIIRWNQHHTFAVGIEAIYHIPSPQELGELSALHGATIEVDNHSLTTTLLCHGLHWDAVDAVLRGAAFGSDGKYWSRLTAEGIAIRDNQNSTAKTLADVLATAKTVEKV